MNVIDKKFITEFNKNNNKENYKKVLIDHFTEFKKCRICNDVIYYYDSTFKISKDVLTYKGKSCETEKHLDKDYNLSVCESCLTEKFPEYQQKNKSRVFNQLNYITEYAFNIPNQVSIEWMKRNYAITEENLIKKYGKDKGQKKWKEYCSKQAISNTFEYKNKVLGWSKEKFDEYNRSRSVTLKNLIDRHGEEEGTDIWKSYCDKQKYSTTINYFIEKHGVENGTNIYENFCKKRLNGAGYSNISKKLFDELKLQLPENYTYYYAENEWYSYDKKNKKYYLVDFYIRELNIGIEFNGDIWHANPKIYDKDDRPIQFQNESLTAKDIWEKDRIKNTYLKTKFDKLIIIWESDMYNDGLKITIEKIIKEINV